MINIIFQPKKINLIFLKREKLLSFCLSLPSKVPLLPFIHTHLQAEYNSNVGNYFYYFFCVGHSFDCLNLPYHEMQKDF